MFNINFKSRTLYLSAPVAHLIKQKIQFSLFPYNSEKPNTKYVSASLASVNEKRCQLKKGRRHERSYATAPPPSVKDQVLGKVADPTPTTGSKITIIGAGHVGMACAICILCKNISNEICLIDSNEEKAKGEAMDLQHGACFVNDAKIVGGCDFDLTKKSRIIIIAAGAAMKGTQTRLDLLNKNASIIRQYIPQIVLTSPHSIVLIVTNPVDILACMSWKLSGFPLRQVFGIGTVLDSARFRCFMAQNLKIAPSDCTATIIGEHGNSCVPVWSAVNVWGVKLMEFDERLGFKDDGEGWNLMHERVILGAQEVKQRKGYTNWAIGLATATVTEAVLKNTGAVLPISTSVKGLYDIKEDVFMSLPCSLHANGISNIVKLNLTPYEEERLQASARAIDEAQQTLKR